MLFLDSSSNACTFLSNCKATRPVHNWSTSSVTEISTFANNRAIPCDGEVNYTPESPDAIAIDRDLAIVMNKTDNSIEQGNHNTNMEGITVTESGRIMVPALLPCLPYTLKHSQQHLVLTLDQQQLINASSECV